MLSDDRMREIAERMEQTRRRMKILNVVDKVMGAVVAILVATWALTLVGMIIGTAFGWWE